MNQVDNATRRPAVGEPIVVEGTKYRVREIWTEADELVARTSFGGTTVTVTGIDGLVWDKRAGVWRVGAWS